MKPIQQSSRNLVCTCLALAISFLLSGAMSAAFGEDFTTSSVQKKWKVLEYHGKSPRPRTFSATLLPEGGIGFVFRETPDTAMLTTISPSYQGDLLGDLTGGTVEATVDVIRAWYPIFIYYNTGGDRPANVRLYLRTMDRALGESMYWWSNPESVNLKDLMSENSLMPVLLSAQLDPSLWSDRDGHMGTYDASHTEFFDAAVSNVQEIGLSFGGGNNFAFGVGVHPGDAAFQLLNFSVTY